MLDFALANDFGIAFALSPRRLVEGAQGFAAPGPPTASPMPRVRM
jgi:hypothetical protein